MITYLAAGNGDVSTGIGGLWLSSATALIGALALASGRVRSWIKRSRDLADIQQIIEIRERKDLDRIPVHSDTGELTADEKSVHSELILRALREVKPLSNENITDISRIRERTQLDELKSLFARAKASFWSFLGVAIGTSAVLMYGAYAAIFGHVEVGIIVTLSSAIPGTFSIVLYRIQSSIDKRADKALRDLDREVEREIIVNLTFKSSTTIKNQNSREALRILATLRTFMPEATPEELSALLKAISQPSNED